MERLIFLLLVCLLSSMLSLKASEKDSYEKSSLSQIAFSTNVKRKHEKLITNDIKYLFLIQDKLKYSEETLKIFEYEDEKLLSLSNWLEKRFSYIVGEEDFDKMSIEYVATSSLFPYFGTLPEISNRNSIKPIKHSQVIMKNIGTAYYYLGKSFGLLPQFNFKNSVFSSIKLNVYSPRIGMFQIGEGLFASKYKISKDLDSVANSIARIGTYFHEARHTDGHAHHMGFFHDLCPKGHDYEGLSACDKNLNGPYKIGSQVLKELLKNCDKDCNNEEKELLRLRVLDSESRIIKFEVKNQTPFNNENVINNLITVKSIEFQFASFERATQIKKEVLSLIEMKETLKKNSQSHLIKVESKMLDPKFEIINDQELLMKYE